MSSRYPYTYVRRASNTDKVAMQEVVDSFNELAEANENYRLGKAHDCYVLVWAVDGEDVGGGSMVRCSKCGAIRELFEGQIEFCADCGADWDA